MTKWVYSFGAGHNEGGADMKNLLGGKGANLAEMARIGLPVPPGFTITTEVCTHYYDNIRLSARPEGAGGGGAAPHREGRRREVRRQAQAAAGLGALRRARVDAGHDGHGAQSRPQRRDRQGLGDAAGDARFAWDSYRRFIQMYASVVLGVDHHRFEEIIEHVKMDARRRSRTPSSPLRTGSAWSTATRRWSRSETGKPFPRIRRSSCGARSAPCSAAG